MNTCYLLGKIQRIFQIKNHCKLYSIYLTHFSSCGTERQPFGEGNTNPGPGDYNIKGFTDEVIENAKKFKRPQYMKPILEEITMKEDVTEYNDQTITKEKTTEERRQENLVLKIEE